MVWLLIRWQRWRATMQFVRSWENICMVIMHRPLSKVSPVCVLYSKMNGLYVFHCMLLLLWLCDTTLNTQCLLLSSLSRLFVTVCSQLASSWGLSTRDWKRRSSGHRIKKELGRSLGLDPCRDDPPQHPPQGGGKGCKSTQTMGEKCSRPSSLKHWFSHHLFVLVK